MRSIPSPVCEIMLEDRLGLDARPLVRFFMIPVKVPDYGSCNEKCPEDKEKNEIIFRPHPLHHGLELHDGHSRNQGFGRL